METLFFPHNRADIFQILTSTIAEGVKTPSLIDP